LEGDLGGGLKFRAIEENCKFKREFLKSPFGGACPDQSGGFRGRAKYF